MSGIRRLLHASVKFDQIAAGLAPLQKPLEHPITESATSSHREQVLFWAQVEASLVGRQIDVDVVELLSQSQLQIILALREAIGANQRVRQRCAR